MSLLATAVQAFKWSLLGELGSRVIGPLVFIILARILLPEDFGVIAAATVAISFSQVFWDNGLARALIQRNTEDDDHLANTVFWTNLVLSAVVTAALWLAAPTLAAFFRDNRIADVLRVLSLQAPMAATCAVMTALMQKRFEFRRLVYVRLVTTGGPGLASIPLALGGWSYWALAIGVLVGQALQTVVLWRQAGWRPTWTYDWAIARDMLGFAKWTIFSGVLAWSVGWLDAIIVGRFLGSHEMGLYRTGNTLVTLIFGLIFAPLLPILYSSFSRAQHDLARLREALMKVAHAIALIGLPIAAGVLTLRVEISTLVFGSDWTGVDLVIGLLALTHAVGWITGGNNQLYRAIGKPEVDTVATALMLAIYVPVYLISVQRGLEAFLWARLGLASFALVFHVMVCWSVVSIPPLRWLQDSIWPVISAALTATLINWLEPESTSFVARLLFTGLLGIIVYGMLIFLFERRFLVELLNILQASRSLVISAGRSGNDDGESGDARAHKGSSRC